MNYEAIVEGYSDELKLIDAVDMLSRDPLAASEILDYVASRSNNEKTDVQPLETGPTEVTFSQDIQLLSADWVPQYKSQGDLINISWRDTDEEQTLELSCQGPDTYPVPFDVELPSDLHLNTTID
tara:strand:- start:96 stop:470 length:375 start_codon:yes stop_codon:yes gene_type:complete